MTKIYGNLLATDRMLKRLEADKFFSVKDLDDSEAVIPMITWLLWVRARGTTTGQIQIVKGPHYDYNSVKISDAIQIESGRFFLIAERIVFATFSKDLEFDEANKYTIDFNNGEIYVYPAFIDSLGFPFPK
jgi:hypothetical protein